jgi:hypothetical protein
VSAPQRHELALVSDPQNAVSICTYSFVQKRISQFNSNSLPHSCIINAKSPLRQLDLVSQTTLSVQHHPLPVPEQLLLSLHLRYTGTGYLQPIPLTNVIASRLSSLHLPSEILESHSVHQPRIHDFLVLLYGFAFLFLVFLSTKKLSYRASWTFWLTNLPGGTLVMKAKITKVVYLIVVIRLPLGTLLSLWLRDLVCPCLRVERVIISAAVRLEVIPQYYQVQVTRTHQSTFPSTALPQVQPQTPNPASHAQLQPSIHHHLYLHYQTCSNASQSQTPTSPANPSASSPKPT